MHGHYALAFDLLDALIREDATALDKVAATMQAEQETHNVLCAVSAMFVNSLVGVHGDIGALQMLDQGRALFREMSGGPT